MPALVEGSTPEMLSAGHINQFRGHSIDLHKVGGDPSHGSLGQDQWFAHQLERLGLQAGEGGSPLPFEAQVLGDYGAVTESKHPVVGTVGKELPLRQDRQVPGVKFVQIRAINAVDGTVGMSQD